MPPTVTLESLQAAVSDLAKKEDKNEIPWQVWTTIGALLSFGFLFALFYAAWYLPWYIRYVRIYYDILGIRFGTPVMHIMTQMLIQYQ